MYILKVSTWYLPTQYRNNPEYNIYEEDEKPIINIPGIIAHIPCKEIGICANKPAW